MADNMNFCPKCHAKYEAPASAGSAPLQPESEISNANSFQAPKVELPFWAKLWQKRMARKDFWLLFLICMILYAAVSFIPVVCLMNGILIPFILIVCQIISLIIGLFMIRNDIARLHDAGKSAWNILWILLPFIGPVILIVLLCKPGQKGENAWGPEPQRMFGGK